MTPTDRLAEAVRALMSIAFDYDKSGIDGKCGCGSGERYCHYDGYDGSVLERHSESIRAALAAYDARTVGESEMVLRESVDVLDRLIATSRHVDAEGLVLVRQRIMPAILAGADALAREQHPFMTCAGPDRSIETERREFESAMRARYAWTKDVDVDWHPQGQHVEVEASRAGLQRWELDLTREWRGWQAARGVKP